MQGGDVLVIDTDSANVVRIADQDGWIHRAPSEWPGGRVTVCPADEDSGTIKTGAVLDQLPGPGDFETDAARAISAVLEYLRRGGHFRPYNRMKSTRRWPWPILRWPTRD